MPDIAGGQRCALRECNTGDHGITQVPHPTGSTACSHQHGRFLRRSIVELKHPVLEILFYQPVKCCLALGSSAAACHD